LGKMKNLERYARQMVLPEIGTAGQERLLQSKVVIIGCGALGTVSANLLVRAGIGHLKIIDRDFVELNNLQRQALFNEQDALEGLPKAICAAEKLRAINSEIRIEGIAAHISPLNIEAFLEGSNLILDATDNFLTRLLINDAALKLNIPWIFAAVLGNFGMTMNIIPNKTPCYRCFIEHPPPPGALPTCETAGVMAPVVNVIASLQVLEAIKYLVGDYQALSKELFCLDGWNNSFERIAFNRKADCPACVQKDWFYLQAEGQYATTSLCGRDAVQVLPAIKEKISLEQLAQKLKILGEVKLNPFLLHFRLAPYQFSIFEDGRAIIKGTNDENEALNLYAKYIGY
jgi:molybdopterin/thiamine biosynthesis adenylyltransferase